MSEKLKDLSPGEKAEITGYERSGKVYREKLLAMGLTKETCTIAIAGNPNCVKTTLFNGLTGSNQRIGNWPGVTIERKEGKYRYGGKEINIVDLPGIYSLSAHSEDEKIARGYVLSGSCDKHR